MIIGSNNSLTYLKPSNIWLKVKARLKKCQEVDYEDQYTFWGVRYFDLRLYVNKHNHIIVKNDTHEYTLFSFYQVLDYFDKRGDVVVNVTLDASFSDFLNASYDSIEKKFVEACHIIDTIYHNIEFRGGTRKFDDKPLYQFKETTSFKDIEVVCPAKWSITYRIVTKWMPFLIGKFNKRYIDRFNNKHVFLVLNYVNRR